MKIINLSCLCLAVLFFSACTKEKLDTDLLIGHWEMQEIIVNGQGGVFDASIPLILKEEDQYSKNQESGLWSYDKNGNTLSLKRARTNTTDVYTVLELSLNDMRLEIEYEHNGETLHTIEVYYKEP